MKVKAFDPSQIEVGEDIDLPDDLDALVERQIAIAEEEIKQSRMQIRWGQSQVEVIKQAAKLMDIPYQTYAKQVLFRQALEDIERIQKLKSI